MTGWDTKSLGDVCEILDSRRRPVTKKDRRTGEYPYYGATGIVDYVDAFIFDEPLVLVGEDGAKWASGEGTAFAVCGRCWVNNHAHVLRPFQSVLLDDFLVYYLVHQDLSPFVSGLTVPKLNQANLREIPVPLPPIAEQRRIVAIIDGAFEGIATAKANAEKNLKNAREVFEGHLAAVFSTRNEGWTDRPLHTLCRRITVGHVGSMANQYKPVGIPFLRSQNIRPFSVSMENLVFIDDEFHATLAKSSLLAGDVALVRTGYPGTAAVIPDTLGVANCSDLVIVRPGPEVDAHFLTAFFNSSFGKTMVSGKVVGAAQKHFNVGAAKEVLLHLPPLREQQAIVVEVDELRTETDRLESLLARKLVVLDELKRSILQQAFAGALLPKRTDSRLASLL